MTQRELLERKLVGLAVNHGNLEVDIRENADALTADICFAAAADRRFRLTWRDEFDYDLVEVTA